METRFEVLHNGKRACVAGIDGDGVLSAVVSYVKRPKEKPRFSLSTGGLGHFVESREHRQHVGWQMPEVGVGDEITIRIFSGGQFDNPSDLAQSPKRTVDDPELGRMDYHVDAWDADIAFDCRPFESAHIHLIANESGPSEQHKTLLREFVRRHSVLWPQIAAALVRCHESIETTQELEKRLNKRIGIDIQSDASALSLGYKIDSEPACRSYFVKLRDWIVTEVGTLD